ncbi:hypothetical protein LIER_19642 [Lithospermum erythrorhizon]|uniref:Uncharacterized protein n=1 Tax=Lithospermum erythrorhizon TaxID=34254 RepID=A0AAV3QL55_LITER
MGTLGQTVYTLGFWMRETGQAMDRLGSILDFKEPIIFNNTCQGIEL